MKTRRIVGLAVCAGLAACSADPAASESAAESQTQSESESGASTASGSESETSSETETETGTETETETDSDDTQPEGNLLLSDAILNIAHRGGGRLRPEATLVAFEHALAVGADVIEFDLHASVDGRIVVIHDSTVDRTTDGSGTVDQMTFDELRGLDAGFNFSPDGGETFPYRGMGIQIPALEEVFESFPDRYYLMEIKQVEPSIVPTLVELLALYEVEERVVIASFNQVTLDELRALEPSLLTAMSASEMITFNAEGGEPGYEAPCEFIQPPWDFVSPEMVQNGHALGLKVHPWTVNNADLMVQLLDDGVDGIMTDDPLLLDEVLADAP